MILHSAYWPGFPGKAEKDTFERDTKPVVQLMINGVISSRIDKACIYPKGRMEWRRIRLRTKDVANKVGMGSPLENRGRQTIPPYQLIKAITQVFNVKYNI